MIPPTYIAWWRWLITQNANQVQSFHQTRSFQCASHPLPSSAPVLKAHDFLIFCHLHQGRKEKWHRLWTLGICVPVVMIDYRGKRMHRTAERTTSRSIQRPLSPTNMCRVTSLKTKAGECYRSDTPTGSDVVIHGFISWLVTSALQLHAALCILHEVVGLQWIQSTDTEESSAIPAAL